MSQRNYAVDLKWPLILGELGLSANDILRAAQLPLDLFQRESASLTPEGYYRLWNAINDVAGDPKLPLALVDAMRPESFSPVFFACLSSQSMDAALIRLRDYKPLVGPMTLDIKKSPTETSVEISGLPGDAPPPPLMMAMELVFFVHLARLGTRDRVQPTKVESPVSIEQTEAFTEWFGCPITDSSVARVSFRRLDAERPFLTASPAMWEVFEPSLRRRLSEATSAETTTDRLRCWFNESIPSGRTSISAAARDLGVSTRTLQRRLSVEGTNFQAELSAARKALAQHYLTRTQISVGEIAFLLGYAEQNSFYRAFHEWTGASPEATRKAQLSMS